MSAFDKIIGYDTIKDELRQICDMVKNPALYKRLGAKLPRGVLLYGEPGLGNAWAWNDCRQSALRFGELRGKT